MKDLETTPHTAEGNLNVNATFSNHSFPHLHKTLFIKPAQYTFAANAKSWYN
jgi:hypothetical protein